MARLFVMNDNLTVRVEVYDQSGENDFVAMCVGHQIDVAEERESYRFEDAVAAAERHADQCRRCADPDCRTTPRHDAGHRCRKG